MTRTVDSLSNRVPAQNVTFADVERYRRNGILFPLPALGADAVAQYRHELERVETTCAPAAREALVYKPHLVLPFLAELIRTPAILDAVQSIIGPNILVWGSGFFIKEPRSAQFVSWHQDITYWGLSPPEVVTAWIAFSASTSQSGCMRVIPGSHTRGLLEHEDTFDGENLLSRGQQIAAEVDPMSALDVTLLPGQMSLHDVKLIHASQPNRSDDRRIGFAVRYVPPHVRQAVGRVDSASLVRGRDDYGHFEAEPTPLSEFDENDMKFRQSIWQRNSTFLMDGAERRARRGLDD